MTPPDAASRAATPGLPRIRWGHVRSTVGLVLLPMWFLLYDLLTVQGWARDRLLFIDIEVYRRAVLTTMAGSDPWAPAAGTLAFAAPPPTLLLYLPTALVPLPVAIVGVTLVLSGAAWWSVRRLGLPIWWMLFPPVFQSLLVGNPDVLVLAFLLVRGPWAGLAGVAKVYGFVPLVLQRRWTAVAAGLAISLVMLPLWLTFLADFSVVEASLRNQAAGFSAWGTWFLIPTLIALWALRRNGAEWLVVPAVWPDTQSHYAAMSLPAVRDFPIAAAIIGLATPLAPPLAVIVVAVQTMWRARRGATPGSGTP